MELSLVFNELSRQLAPDEQTARDWMSIFAQSLKKAQEHNIRSFRTDFLFSQIELTEGYPIEKWFNDTAVDEPTREFIRDITSTFQLINPFLSDQSDDDEVVKRSNRLVGTYHGDFATGLTYAYMLEGIAISIPSHTKWDTHHLTLDILEEQDGQPDIERHVTVLHAANSTHFPPHSDWIAERLRYSVGNGSVLLNKLAQWYPHLVFCDNARNQIKKLRGDATLQKVIERLFDLEKFAADWDIGEGFPEEAIRSATYETNATLQEHGRDRNFVCPDGETRLFSYHLKATAMNKALRIHVWPDVEAILGYTPDQKRKILVGYIGDHLPTSRDF